MEPARQMARTIKVVLVDDSDAFARAATAFLKRNARVELLAVANGGTQALELVRQHRPDLVLVDLNMPGMDGLEATRRIKALHAAPKVLAMTLEDLAERETAAERAGADAFLLKTDLGTKLYALIDRLFPGHAHD
ncbi:MAG TPA: response regulator transcription factor [Burkholderiales bacterium]|nr:response regulator transcription factor [Burkholderiales bacterium]